MNIENLIPKDKFDIATAEKLKNYSFEEIKPIVPHLLEWLQDMNCPISKLVADYLITFSENIAGEILQILKGSDKTWKYWILIVFGKTIKNELVLNEIKRIAQNPTDGEIEEETPKLAKEIVEI